MKRNQVPVRQMIPPGPKLSRAVLAERAFEAARQGDLDAALVLFMDAIAADRRNAALYFNRGLVQERRGRISEACADYCTALRLAPAMADAARRLSRLLARFTLEDAAALDAAGLSAALSCKTIAFQPIVRTVLQRFATQPHIRPIMQDQDRAKELLDPAVAAELKDPLLLTALAAGLVADADLERLFTALRRALLLSTPAPRFAERDLFDLALALLAQCWANEHAWEETAAETAALDALALDRERLSAPDPESSRKLLLRALYRPLRAVCNPPLTVEVASRIKPKSMREMIVRRLSEDAEEARHAAEIPALAAPRDAVSVKVAAQYEASPYPRWSSLHVSAPGSLGRALGQFASPQQLGFLDKPFDVLIAGTGTGQQALQSSFGYGPNAQLLAVDISAASLGYAKRMACRYAGAKIEFLRADILDISRLDRTFDIIECVGVLHHMADPFAGWRSLLDRLAPGGLMYVGLYSAKSRINIAALRNTDAEHPGTGSSVEAIRSYRARILRRAPGAPGTELLSSADFYTLSEFRDLVLHESEQCLTLPQISAFLQSEGLEFRGFTLPPEAFATFRRTYPDSPWPGRLDDWDVFEDAHPRTFDGMYRFWCARR